MTKALNNPEFLRFTATQGGIDLQVNMIRARENNLDICIESVKQMRLILDELGDYSGVYEEIHALREHLKRIERAIKAVMKAEQKQGQQAQISSAAEKPALEPGGNSNNSALKPGKKKEPPSCTTPELETQMRLIASAIVADLPRFSSGTGAEATVSVITEIALRLVAYVNDQEKAWRRQRQASGIAAAKERNQQFGHPKIPRSREFPDVVKAWESGAISQSEAWERLGLTRSTFFRQLREYRTELAAQNSQQTGEPDPKAPQGTLFFFTGLAGAGKTTIGGLFYQRLKESSPDAILLDGDKQRNIAGCTDVIDLRTLERDDDRIYSTEARKRGALALAPWCRDQLDKGKDIVLCTVSMFNEVRDWYRENVDHFCEIYIRADRRTLLERNQKGLYSPGRRNVVGVDLPWDEPVASDEVIQNDGERTPDDIVDELAARYLTR